VLPLSPATAAHLALVARGIREPRAEPSVRAGSVPQRSSTGSSGHQRSPTVRTNPRSPACRLKQLG